MPNSVVIARLTWRLERRKLGDLRKAESLFRFVTVSSREIFFCGREIFVINNPLDINGYYTD